MQITPEQAVAFRRAIEAGDDEAAVSVLKDFNENTINWDNIEDAGDIKAVLLETERMFADLVTDAKGGVQSNAQTKRLANLVNASAGEVGNLFRDTRGGGGIAARFYAAHRTMLASAAEVRRTARASLDNPGSSVHEAKALRALQVHAAIQAEVKGAQTEIARALQGMAIIKDEAANNFRQFDELRRQFAGSGEGKTAWEKHMDDILGMRDLDELNAAVTMTRAEKMKNIFFEYTINSMLSSPKTHVINFVSNVLNTFIYAADRTLGGAFRSAVHGDRAALREARIDVVSKLTRADEAWQLAKQAWRDGAPVTDKRQRIEFRTRQAGSIEGTPSDIRAGDDALPDQGAPIFARKREVTRDALGTAIAATEYSIFQRAVNTLGRIVRIPGRALITGDEFFKAVNRNAEISVLSFRKADDEALAAGLEYGTKKYEDFVQKRMKALMDDSAQTVPASKEGREIAAQAIEKARRTTFQEAPISSFGSKAEQLVNSNQWFKLIFAPFFRTPMNILRQGIFDRTPLGYLFKQNQQILREGSPREVAELHARMYTGLGAMGAFYGMFGGPDEDDRKVQIVGTVPRGTSAKSAGVKDYSIRFGDGEWHQFNRLEPLGMWLGMMADMKTHEAYNREDENIFVAFGQGAMGAFMNNVGSKTFMKSITDFQDMLEGINTARPATIERAWDRFAAGELGKLIPQFFKGTAAALDGEDDTTFARQTWDVLDTMAARSSMFHETQPYSHDLLGNKIEKDAGLSMLINPFAQSRDHLDDPVYKAMWDVGLDIQPMAKTLGAGAFQLTSDEHAELTGTVADVGLYEALHGLVTSSAWEGMSVHLQAALMKEQFNTARTAARQLFLARNPAVLKRAQQEQVDALLLLTSDSE